MCGIFAILGSKAITGLDLRTLAVEAARRIQHRGPDWAGVWMSDDGTSVMAHQRLAIVDPDNAEQPLHSTSGDPIVLCVNGEIYNTNELRAEFPDYKWATGSDCEVIIPLYQKYGVDCVDKLSGDFAFVVFNSRTGNFLVARDPIGVVPVFIGWGQDGALYASSEMKALKAHCAHFEALQPGHCISGDNAHLLDAAPQRWFKANWIDGERVPSAPYPSLKDLREAFIAAVDKRLMADVPFGVLISGGLDSGLVSATAMRLLKERVAKGQQVSSSFAGSLLHSFSIGMENAPDLKWARATAAELGTKHHEYIFTFQQALDAIPLVIWHLETYDVTTIRAGTPMFLLSRRIKSLGIKMVLSGEGSDEVFGGYLYFHGAPDDKAFHAETVRRVKKLHEADCLRANKSTMAWGLEARVPFLDRDFLQVAMNMDPALKRAGNGKIEKDLLRRAFDAPEAGATPYLSKELLWRQKEQFSDGVGYNWIDGLKAHAEKLYTDTELKLAQKRYHINPPQSKEALFYRTLFEEQFPERGCDATVVPWVPMWSKSQDPSGRVQEVHEQKVTA